MGAIAVVVTLFYLAIEIRQNSKIVEENSRQLRLGEVDATLQSFARYRALLAEPQMAEIYHRGSEDFGRLSETEKIQFNVVLDEYLLSYWALFHRLNEQAYDKSDWQSHLRALSEVLTRPGIAVWWRERKCSYPQKFVASIDDYFAAQNIG